MPRSKRATVPGNLTRGRQHFRRGGNLFYVTRFGPHLALLGLAHGCAGAGHYLCAGPLALAWAVLTGFEGGDAGEPTDPV